MKFGQSFLQLVTVVLKDKKYNALREKFVSMIDGVNLNIERCNTLNSDIGQSQTQAIEIKGKKEYYESKLAECSRTKIGDRCVEHMDKFVMGVPVVCIGYKTCSALRSNRASLNSVTDSLRQINRIISVKKEDLDRTQKNLGILVTNIRQMISSAPSEV
jgi:hypothetical protein